MSDDYLIQAKNLSKTYLDGSNEVKVLNGVELNVSAGEKMAIIGPSGSGKSTLLHLLGGLDNPSSGAVLFEGQSWQLLSEKQRCRLRNKHLGFVYQFHHLLPEFSALENVAMPLLLANQPVQQAMEQAHVMLSKVGLAARITHRPAQLSGGERQRVAIARALTHNPSCVLADEPTGNLDEDTALAVFDLMLELNESLQTAFIIVTHDLSLAKRIGRTHSLAHGRLADG